MSWILDSPCLSDTSDRSHIYTSYTTNMLNACCEREAAIPAANAECRHGAYVTICEFATNHHRSSFSLTETPMPLCAPCKFSQRRKNPASCLVACCASAKYAGLRLHYSTAGDPGSFRSPDTCMSGPLNLAPTLRPHVACCVINTKHRLGQCCAVLLVRSEGRMIGG